MLVLVVQQYNARGYQVVSRDVRYGRCAGFVSGNYEIPRYQLFVTCGFYRKTGDEE